MNNEKVKIGFYGGVGSVTGANFLLETPKIKIIVDCGMKQGAMMCDETNANPFPYDLESIDALVVTHAHLDHIGRIPKLVKDGFKGKIYSTPETKKLVEVMLPDSARILLEEAQKCNTKPIYTEDDVDPIFNLWETVPYYAPIQLGDVEVTFKNAGHILGSSMVECLHKETGKILFTGDLGNPPSLILKDTDIIEDANYLVMESVYGDRTHEEVEDRLSQLEDVIEDVVEIKGTLLIPTFSIERTQNILYELNDLVEQKRIPKVSVFLDSPLATKVTEIYRQSKSDFNDETQEKVDNGDDVFSFPGLTVVTSQEESKELYKKPGPKIIIAGSGMSHGGRIIQHEKQNLSDKNTTLLVVGYQAPGSLGRQLVDGAKEVSIGGETIDVRAKVMSVSGYSGHRDRDGLVEFVNGTNVALKKVFVTMGEPKSSQFLAQRLRDYLGVDAVVPNLGDVIELE